MRERADWVVPYFNDKYRFDKPPFIYWTQMASYRLFGENDFAARFPSTIAAALTAALLFAWGRRMAGERVGWWAAIIFTLCLQTFVHARAAVADMWLVFFVTVAHWAGYELLREYLDPARLETARPRAVEGNPHLKYWRILFYLALALGFLAKGPLGWLPLLTVLSMKFFIANVALSRRFWFFTGMIGAFLIVCIWGVPALLATNGEYFEVGIGRHVVERSFGPMEGHGAQSFRSYLLTLPFYFGTVFVSFFPWSIKLPSLVWRLSRKRDAIDKYLLSGVLIVFVIMSVIKTKLPHYTLPAFPLLALLLARHLFELQGVFVRFLRFILPARFLASPFYQPRTSPRFGPRTAAIAVAVSLVLAFGVFPLLAPTFASAELFKKSRDDLLPEMDFANVDYFEPSVVWYFRARAKGFFRGVFPNQVDDFMRHPGPRFIIVPTELAKTVYPEIPAGWKSYRTEGYNYVKGTRVDLTLVLKRSQ